VLVVAGLVVGGVVVLALWSTPPAWLAEPRRVVLAGLQWARTHLLTVAVAGLVVAVASLVAAVVVPLLVALRQRDWARRDKADEHRRAQNRKVMLQRVHRKWIRDVLKPSLVDATQINLQLMRVPTHQGGAGQLEPLSPGTPLSKVFQEAGGGLLLLGAPGSGKTTALLKLTSDLIHQAEADGEQPIPVVFNLSSWAARRLPLIEWLIDELQKSYDVPRLTATQWVNGDEILPLLDGLDEVAEAHRADCVDAIKAFQRRHGLAQFAVCSRTKVYTALPNQLQVEAVELQPPTREQIYGYLARPSLASVREALEADDTLWTLLQSPLVLNIVALTYHARSADALRAAGTQEHRLAGLFKAYTDRMLEHRRGHYTPGQMIHWLAWLARSMRDRSQSEFHLDRVQPDWLPTKAQQRLAVLMLAISAGLLAGLVDGVVYGLVYGLTRGLINGLAIGLFFALFAGLRKTEPAEGARWSWPRARLGLLGGLILGLVVGLVSSLIDALVFGLFFWLLFALFAGLSKTQPVEQVRWSWPRARVGLLGGLSLGLILGLVYGLAYKLVSELVLTLVLTLVFALVIGLFGGLINGLVPALVDKRTTPNEGIRRSTRHALATGLVFGLIVGLVFGLVFELVFELVNGLGGGLRNGLVLGLAVGLFFGGLACLQHLVLRGLLAYNDFAPLDYVRFLDEATERLFLRRAGSGYLFVHRLLLEYLADLGTTAPPHALKLGSRWGEPQRTGENRPQDTVPT